MKSNIGISQRPQDLRSSQTRETQDDTYKHADRYIFGHQTPRQFSGQKRVDCACLFTSSCLSHNFPAFSWLRYFS